MLNTYKVNIYRESNWNKQKTQAYTIHLFYKQIIIIYKV